MSKPDRRLHFDFLCIRIYFSCPSLLLGSAFERWRVMIMPKNEMLLALLMNFVSQRPCQASCSPYLPPCPELLNAIAFGIKHDLVIYDYILLSVHNATCDNIICQNPPVAKTQQSRKPLSRTTTIATNAKRLNLGVCSMDFQEQSRDQHRSIRHLQIPIENLTNLMA